MLYHGLRHRILSFLYGQDNLRPMEENSFINLCLQYKGGVIVYIKYHCIYGN